jgi:hypothetical protein
MDEAPFAHRFGQPPRRRQCGAPTFVEGAVPLVDLSRAAN